MTKSGKLLYQFLFQKGVITSNQSYELINEDVAQDGDYGFLYHLRIDAMPNSESATGLLYFDSYFKNSTTVKHQCNLQIRESTNSGKFDARFELYDNVGSSGTYSSWVELNIGSDYYIEIICNATSCTMNLYNSNILSSSSCLISQAKAFSSRTVDNYTSNARPLYSNWDSYEYMKVRYGQTYKFSISLSYPYVGNPHLYPIGNTDCYEVLNLSDINDQLSQAYNEALGSNAYEDASAVDYQLTLGGITEGMQTVEGTLGSNVDDIVIDLQTLIDDTITPFSAILSIWDLLDSESPYLDLVATVSTIAAAISSVEDVVNDISSVVNDITSTLITISSNLVDVHSQSWLTNMITSILTTSGGAIISTIRSLISTNHPALLTSITDLVILISDANLTNADHALVEDLLSSILEFVVSVAVKACGGQYIG